MLNHLVLIFPFKIFLKELASLPGEYAPPDGRLFLALEDNDFIGCVALRKFAKGIGEMKRMYLRKKFRGRGIGRKLAITVIKEAKVIGYKEIRLDTVPWMKEAIELYLSLGFQEIEPYRFNPIPGSRYFALKL